MRLSAHERVRQLAKKWGVSYERALHRALDIAEGKDVLGILSSLKDRYQEGLSPDELAIWDVLYSWLAYVFDYRAR